LKSIAITFILLVLVIFCIHCLAPQAFAQQNRQSSSSSLSSQSGQSNHLLRQVVRVNTEQPEVRIERRDKHTYVVGSVLINAPRERVWSTLVDYDRSTEIFNNLSLCQVIGNEGDVKLVRQVVKPGGPIKFDYVVNLTETKPSLIKWKRRSGSFREVMGAWELESVAKTSSTLVTYSIHLDGGIALPPWLLASQVKGYLPTVLNALKVKLEPTKQGV